MRKAKKRKPKTILSIEARRHALKMIAIEDEKLGLYNDLQDIKEKGKCCCTSQDHNLIERNPNYGIRER